MPDRHAAPSGWPVTSTFCNNMKRTVFLVLTILIITLGYFLSYRSSYLRQDVPGDNKEYRLVVAGIPLPYNDTTKIIFSILYRPLIEGSAASQPTKEFEGTICRIDLTRLELMLSREGQDGILFQIPISMKPSLSGFANGDLIQGTYGVRAKKDTPFCYSFEIRTIRHVSKK